PSHSSKHSHPGIRRAHAARSMGRWKKEYRNGDKKRQPRDPQTEAAQGEEGSGSVDSVGDRRARTWSKAALTRWKGRSRANAARPRSWSTDRVSGNIPPAHSCHEPPEE